MTTQSKGVNNLEVFRQEVKRFVLENNNEYNTERQSKSSQQLYINSYQQFKQLASYLCSEKLLDPTEQRKLITRIQPSNNSKSSKSLNMGVSLKSQSNAQNNSEQETEAKKKVVSFPLSVKQFQNLIMVQFGDQDCKNLITDIKKFQTLLKQIKGTLNIWKDKGLTNEQKYELQSIFSRGNQKIIKLCQDLKHKKLLLQSISEQQIQMIKSLDQWVDMQKIVKKFHDFRDYQKYSKNTISALFNKYQVKQAHFKKKDVLTKAIPDVLNVKGFNSKNDQPIEVVLLSKTSINFQKINQQLIKFDALKQLSLSEHFPKFLGFNTHSSPTSIQYYVEMIQSKNLSELMKSQKALNITSPLLKYWMYKIYKSLYDIFLMCSYQPELPIKLEDFQVKDLGLQIILKNVRFIQKRKPLASNVKIDPLETNLLHNLGLILLNLLGIAPQPSQINKNLNKLQQKCFFKSLLNVKEGHRNYQKEVVQNYLNFFNLQTHPILEQSQFSDGVQIVGSYVAIFGNQ